MEHAKTYQAYINKNLIIHTYVSPEKYGGNATHILETPSKLAIVDAQYIKPYAIDFSQYARSLNKPIDAIFITHSHPDHYLGLFAFEDVKKIYALDSTTNNIITTGEYMVSELHNKMGDELISRKLIIPTHTITPGILEWEGYQLNLSEVHNGESESQLLINIPEYGICIVQDLLYNGLHLYVGNLTFNSWINILMDMETRDILYFLVGHGAPTNNKDIITFNIRYLKTAREAYEKFRYSKDKNGFMNYMIESYPRLGGRSIFQHELDIMFK